MTAPHLLAPPVGRNKSLFPFTRSPAGALTAVAQGAGHRPMQRKVSGLIPIQGTGLGFGGLVPGWGCERGNCEVYLSFFSLPSPLSKKILKKKKKKAGGTWFHPELCPLLPQLPPWTRPSPSSRRPLRAVPGGRTGAPGDAGAQGARHRGSLPRGICGVLSPRLWEAQDPVTPLPSPHPPPGPGPQTGRRALRPPVPQGQATGDLPPTVSPKRHQVWLCGTSA